jgi:hypothetical protein
MCVDVYGGRTTTLSFLFLPQEPWNWNPKLHFTWDKHDIQHGTKHARLLGTIWCEVQSANVQKGIWLKEIDLHVHSSFESVKTILFWSLGSALPRCQGKIGTQSFSYTLPYTILNTKKELTIGMVWFHS